MFIIIDEFDSPSHRIRGNDKWTASKFLRWSAKLFGFPRFNLCSLTFSV